jgi:hypothetical protein
MTDEIMSVVNELNALVKLTASPESR